MAHRSLDISSLLVIEEDLPRPQWSIIGDWISGHVPPAEQFDAWTDAVDQWLDALAESLDGRYYLDASQNFMLLAPDQGPSAPSLLPTAERCRAALLDSLSGVAEFDAPGKMPIVVLSDSKTYYQYVSPFYSEGEWGDSGGVQIREGFPHIALVNYEFPTLEHTLAHELTHAALVHLTLPLWVEEGLTQIFARRVSVHLPPLLDDEAGQRHQRFWRNHSLDQFWNGTGFHRATPAQRFSYQLAEVLLTLLVEEHRPGWFGRGRNRQQQFFQFLQHADEQDAGEAAALEYLGMSLHQIAAKFLGPGDWSPRSLDAE